MPTIFGHPAVPLALKVAFPGISRRLLAAAIICSLLPDIDVISFKLGISYSSFLGHRGASHSFVFALGTGLLLSLFARPLQATRKFVFAVIFLSTASHIILDAMTNGGLGPAMWWPFSDERVFLPWRPIEVSPLAVSRFLGERGMMVLKSELLWIWAPLLATAVVFRLVRRLAR